MGVTESLGGERGPGRVLLVFGDAVADLAGVAERRAVDLAGANVEQVAEHEPDRASDAGAGPVGGADGAEVAAHADLLAHRTVHDEEHRTPAGARRRPVQKERLGEHRGERGDDDGVVHRQAAGHHRVDRDLFGCDGSLSHGLDADQVVGGVERPREAGLDRVGRRGHDRETIGPAVGVEVFLDGERIVERDPAGLQSCAHAHVLSRPQPTVPIHMSSP